jgi:HK97 family phage prohead protease
MQVRINGDTVTVEGYVNAVERRSKPLQSRIGQFVERICKGAFKRALDRNDDVRLLLNHDWERDLGGTKDGNLELAEDSIGLHARAEITDAEVARKARDGELVGWSFGFTDRDVDNHEENGIPTRDVKDLDLYEVSILDRSKTPAYDGTLVSVRSDERVQYHGAIFEQEIQTRDVTPKQEEKAEPDYTAYESIIEEMKGQ